MLTAIAPHSGTNLEWRASTDVEGVMIGDARKDGPTVTIFGNVHPDELSGVTLATMLPHALQIERGRVIVVQANLQAAKLGTRGTPKEDGGEENLNRYFREQALYRGLRCDLPYEERRAQELMPYIKEAAENDGAILDNHEFEAQGKYGRPHIITERTGLAIARKIGPSAIVFGFAEAEPGGTDGYGHSLGIPALCAELGSMGPKYHKTNVLRAGKYIDRFLDAMGLVDLPGLRPVNQQEPTLVQVDASSAYIREGDKFRMARDFHAFELLQKGELIAIDGDTEIYADAEREQVILFPKPTAPKIGREAFELGYPVAN